MGVDANLHLYEEFFIQAQAAKSWSPLGNKGAEAFHLGLHRFETNSEFWLQLEDLGKAYGNPLGWTPILDKQGVNMHLYLNPFPKLRFLPRIDLTYDYIWRRNHAKERTRLRHRLNFQPYLHHDFALYLDGIYDDYRTFEYGVYHKEEYRTASSPAASRSSRTTGRTCSSRPSPASSRAARCGASTARSA